MNLFELGSKEMEEYLISDLVPSSDDDSMRWI